MTNYERYFGTPERASKMRVRFVHDISQRLLVEKVMEDTWDYAGESFAFYSVQEYLEWLQEECDT